jgi:hypothetical protein
VDGATVTAHATLRDAVRAAGDALEEYLAIAKIKNAHDAHERAAHEVLRHFRGAVRAFERSTTRDVVADDDKGKGVDVTDIDALSSLAFEGADGATEGARTPQRRRAERDVV